MDLYRMIEEPKEGEIVQFLGVYVTRWRTEWGEPTVGFIDSREMNKKMRDRISELDDLIARLAIDSPLVGSVDYHCNGVATERLCKEKAFLEELLS